MPGEVRFKDVQLADFGSTVRMDSNHARDGDSIGTPMFRSPEAHLQMSWVPQQTSGLLVQWQVSNYPLY